MPRKSKEERLQRALKAVEENKILAKTLAKEIKEDQSRKERKERTHRLIQIGAICEEVLGDKITEGERQNRLRAFLRGQEERGQWYTKAILGEVDIKVAPDADYADGAAENNQP